MNQSFNVGQPSGGKGRRTGLSGAARRGSGRACVAEPLEERLLMAMAKATGGSGYSGTLSTNKVIRQQQLICDPAEPTEGSTSVQYDADQVTLRGMVYGPGYGPLGNLTAAVEILVGQERRLQTLPSFLDSPQGKETGYVQVYYQLKGQAGQITPPRDWTLADETGTEGVDTHALTFNLLPAVQDDAVVRYVIYADAGSHSNNPPDYLMTLDGKRLGPADLLPAIASTAPTAGSIYGTTFEDVNADGMYDTGDKPVGGVTVFVDLDRNGKLDDGEPNQLSAPDDGTYLFRSLRPGTYPVREITPPGYIAQMTVPAEGFHLVPVVAGRRVRFVDFGNLRPGTVSGVVFNDVNGNGIHERSEIGGVAGATVYVDLNRNMVRDPGEPADVSTDPAGAWSISGLAPGTYVIRQLPPAGYVQTAPASFNVVTLSGSGDALTGVTFGDHAVGPRVAGVYLSGSTWSTDFLRYLDAINRGDAAAGYLVIAQGQAIPWTTVNRISIRFDSPVNIDSADLDIGSVAGRYDASSFAYDPATYTASWRLSSGVVSDRLLLSLSSAAGGVAGTNGQPLDGEWTNGFTKYPSGDGTPGGDFRFSVNVLGGDVTGDGVVNALDLGQMKARLNRSTADPGSGNSAYSVFADVTSDGKINALDLGAAKLRLNQRLPRTPLPLPVIVARASPGGVSVSSVTREVFSDRPVL